MKMSVLYAILTLCLFTLSAAEYKTFEDAVKAAEVFIAEKYTTPIAKDSATKKLLLIVNDQTLPDAVKIENIQEFIRARTEENVKPNTNLVKKAIPVKGQPWIVAETGMQLVYVAPGTFKMGEPKDGRDNEKPVHGVTLTQGYWIGKYEVTQYEYEKIMGNNPSVFKGNTKPVDGVSWYNAVIFCQKLTKRERASGCLPAGYEYCLPTEAQWEFAARGGAESKAYKFSGGNNLDSLAWFYENSGNARLSEEWDVDNLDKNECRPHDVGTKTANELGIHDMLGNVWEWCSNWYEDYPDSNVVDPVGAESSSCRVLRGGSWRSTANLCRIAIRHTDSPNSGHYQMGFRIVMVSSLK